MKRDLALVRNILLEIEKAPAGEAVTTLTIDFDSKTFEDVIEHLYLMAQEDLIEASFELDAVGRPWNFRIERILWAGHEFLANAKNDVVWKKALTQLGDKATSVSLTVMNALLSKIMKDTLLGLPPSD